MAFKFSSLSIWAFLNQELNRSNLHLFNPICIRLVDMFMIFLKLCDFSLRYITDILQFKCKSRPLVVAMENTFSEVSKFAKNMQKVKENLNSCFKMGLH